MRTHMRVRVQPEDGVPGGDVVFGLRRTPRIGTRAEKTLRIDGLVERMPLDLRPLPGAGMSRSITVVARDGELGELPKAFADFARVSLAGQIAGQMGEIGSAALAGLEAEEELA